jgi:hypothetical protein
MSDTIFRRKLPELSWKAKEVVKEIDNHPHLLVRIDITGTYFPHRAATPFIRIVHDKKIILSIFAQVSGDNRKFMGYFQTDLPKQGTIEFGFGARVMGRITPKLESKVVKRLDQKRLTKDVRIVSAEYRKTKKW